jgi:N-acetylglutamate synthase/N-acetylornithine aminotransferase
VLARANPALPLICWGARSAGMHAGLRDSSHRADLALVVSSQDAAVATAMSSLPSCAPAVAANKQRLAKSSAARAVLITAGQEQGGGEPGLGRDMPHMRLRPFAVCWVFGFSTLRRQ